MEIKNNEKIVTKIYRGGRSYTSNHQYLAKLIKLRVAI